MEEWRRPAQWETPYEVALRKANEGSVYAMYNLAEQYWYGLDGVTHDAKEAFSWFLKSAELGFDWSYEMVAWCYQEGCGVAKDAVKAQKWYAKYDATLDDKSLLNSNRPCPCPLNK